MKSLNSTRRKNYPGVDLADDNLGIAVQVTASSRSEKIFSTIEKFRNHSLYEKYHRLVVFVITDKKASYQQASFDKYIEGTFVFTASEDILDFDDMYESAVSLPPASLEEAIGLLRSYTDEVDTSRNWRLQDVSVESILAISVALVVNTDRGESRYIRFGEGAVYVNRLDEERVLSEAMHAHSGQEDRGNWISVIGEAGQGKSSILWYLTQHPKFEHQGLCFAAQIYGTDIYGLIEDANPQSKIILIDTIDSLLGNDLGEVGKLISVLRSKGNLVITTCRVNEAREVALAPDRSISLGSYNDVECRQAIKNYVYLFYSEYSKDQRLQQFERVWNLLEGRRQVRELTFDPLILSMIFKVYVPDSIPSDINTQRVYDDFLRFKVLEDRTVKSRTEGQRRLALCLQIARKLVFPEGNMIGDTIALSKLEGAVSDVQHHDIASLISSGILNWGIGQGSVRFFHQTFLEYVAAIFVRNEGGPEYVEVLVDDFNELRLDRLPVLKQVAIQEDAAGYANSRPVYTVIDALRSVETESSLQLFLEVMGKINSPLRFLTTALEWIETDLDRYSQSVILILRNYPIEKYDFACEVLIYLLRRGIRTHQILKHIHTMASINPVHIGAMIDKIVACIRPGDNSVDSLLRAVLIECIDHGSQPLFGTLQQYVFSIPDSTQHSIYESLHHCTRREGIEQFCLDTLDLVFESQDPSSAAAWAALTKNLDSGHKDVNRIVKKLLRESHIWKVDQKRALSAGSVVGNFIDVDTIIELASKVEEIDVLERVFLMQALSSVPVELADNVIETLISLPNNDDMIVALKWSVASKLRYGAIDMLWRFLELTPWPENGSRTSIYAEIFEKLALSDATRVGDWLNYQLSLCPRKISDLALMFCFLGFLRSSPTTLTDFMLSEFWHIAKSGGARYMIGFAKHIGQLSVYRERDAAFYSSEVLSQRLWNVTEAFLEGLRGAVVSNTAFVLNQWDALFNEISRAGRKGTWNSYLKMLRNVPEKHTDMLIEKLVSHYSEDRIANCSEQEILELLGLIKVFVGRYSDQLFSTVHMCWRPVQSITGAQSACYQNMIRDGVSVKDVLLVWKDLQRTVLVSKSQRRLRHALRAILPVVIQFVGVRVVLDGLSETLPKMQDHRAQQDIVKALLVSPGWTREDTLEMTRRFHFRQEVLDLLTKDIL